MQGLQDEGQPNSFLGSPGVSLEVVAVLGWFACWFVKLVLIWSGADDDACLVVF